MKQLLQAGGLAETCMFLPYGLQNMGRVICSPPQGNGLSHSGGSGVLG